MSVSILTAPNCLDLHAKSLTLTDGIVQQGEWLHVESFGAIGDGIADDTAAINAAVAAAIAQKKPLYGCQKYKLTSTVDLRFIALEMEDAEFDIWHAGTGIILGGDARNYLSNVPPTFAHNPPQKVGTVLRFAGEDSHITPSVRAMGVKSMDLYVGYTEYFHLLADDTLINGQKNPAYSSAYSNINLTYAQNIYLEKVGGGWINENRFNLNRCVFLIMKTGGTAVYNHNFFFNCNFESSKATLRVEEGYSNQFLHCRYEWVPDDTPPTLDIPSVYFGPSTHNNIVEKSQLEGFKYEKTIDSNGQALQITNLGWDNVVLTSQEEYTDEKKILTLTPNTPFVSSINAGVTAAPRVKYNTDIRGLTNIKHNLDGSFTILADNSPIFSQDTTELIEIKSGDMFGFSSDLALWKVKMWCYNASHQIEKVQVFESDFNGGLTLPDVGAGYLANAAATGYLGIGVLSTDPIKYVRFEIYSTASCVGQKFTYLRLTTRQKKLGECPRKIFDVHADGIRLSSLTYVDDTDVDMKQVGEGIVCRKTDLSSSKVNIYRKHYNVWAVSGSDVTVKPAIQWDSTAFEGFVSLVYDNGTSLQELDISTIEFANVSESIIHLASPAPTDLVVNSNVCVMLTSSWNNNVLTKSTPASASAEGVAGTIVFDASYVYVCTATNTWKRAAIATW